MKKKLSVKLLNWDAHYVGISALRERQRKSITLEEVAYEASLLLSRSARNITEEIPVFTDWVESNLSAPLKRQKRNSWKWYQPNSRHQIYEDRK